jgi:hypothetical protein
MVSKKEEERLNLFNGQSKEAVFIQAFNKNLNPISSSPKPIEGLFL